MKARSRLAPIRPAAPRPSPLPHLADASAQASAAVAWRTWLDHLPADQRERVLPFFGDRAPETVRSSASRLPIQIRELLAAPSVELPIAPPLAISGFDLDPAVRRALQTPDICLWNRTNGRDLSALIGEFLKNATAACQRVLYLSASPASLEQTLSKLAANPSFRAVRFRAAGERPASGPAIRFGLEEQRNALRPELLDRAAKARAEAESRRTKAASEAELWKTLTGQVRELAALDTRIAEGSQRLERLPEDVRREANLLADDSRPASGPFAAGFSTALVGHRERLMSCERTLQSLSDRSASLDRAEAELNREKEWADPQLADYRASRWWTLAYWQARFNRPLRQHGDSLAALESELRDSRETLLAETAAAQAQRHAAAAARDAEVASLVVAEIGRRRGEIELQLESLRRQHDNLTGHWRQACDGLSVERPGAPTLDAHRAAFEAWHAQTQRERIEPNSHEAVADFLRRLPSLSPVIAGTILALGRSSEFAAAAETPFDFVLIDDADRLTEAELLTLLARAPRALLIGSPTAAVVPFVRLWTLLHRAAPTTYQWTRRSGGYVCTLGALAPGDEQDIESECLADFPEIALRILSKPKLPPRLVQVLFPSCLSAVQAKTFIYRELQDAAVDRVDGPKRFVDTPDRFTIAWDCPALPVEEIVDLEPGLREALCVQGDQLTTCRIEFDKAAGWDAVKIQDWLRRHLASLDAPRTAEVG